MWNDTDFNGTFSSPGGAAKETKKTLLRHVVPVTAQIINHCTQVEGESSTYEYGNMTFHQVSFIGIIRNVIKRANDTTYLIDDMTSSEINVKLQAEDPEDIESEEPVEQKQFIENQYVKVFGIIKSLQGEKIVQAFRILPIKELNQVTHHMLECMNASIHYSQKSNDSTMQFNESTMQNNTRNDESAGLSSCHTMVSNLIKQCHSSEGIHINDIFDEKSLRSFGKNKIKDALEFLSTEGHIYSTIDDEHYKSTEA